MLSQPGCRRRLEDGHQDIVRLAAVELGVGGERDAVAKRRERDALDVVRRHERARRDQRRGLRRANQRDGSARAAPTAIPGQSRVARAMRTA